MNLHPGDRSTRIQKLADRPGRRLACTRPGSGRGASAGRVRLHPLRRRRPPRLAYSEVLADERSGHRVAFWRRPWRGPVASSAVGVTAQHAVLTDRRLRLAQRRASPAPASPPASATVRTRPYSAPATTAPGRALQPHACSSEWATVRVYRCSEQARTAGLARCNCTTTESPPRSHRPRRSTSGQPCHQPPGTVQLDDPVLDSDAERADDAELVSGSPEDPPGDAPQLGVDPSVSDLLRTPDQVPRVPHRPHVDSDLAPDPAEDGAPAGAHLPHHVPQAADGPNSDVGPDQGGSHCFSCGSDAWWYRQDGTGPVCSTCHPDPRSLSGQAAGNA